MGSALSEVEKKMYVTEDLTEFNNILDVYSWIEINVNESTRVYYQSTFDFSIKDPIIERSWIMAYANYYTTKPSLGTWSGNMPYPTYDNLVSYYENGDIIFGKENLSDKDIVFFLKIFNSKYIIANSDSMVKKLKNSPLFDEKYSSGRFVIFSVKNYAANYIQTENNNNNINKIMNVKFQNELIEFDVFDIKSVNISVQYHPFWKAYIDGKLMKIERNDFNLMKLEIPYSNNEIHHIKMIFEKKYFY